MPDHARSSFLKNYTKALLEGTAAVFVGAGFSRAAGFVDWKGLLKDVATDLGLDVDKETDLVALAQYHVNKRRSRSHLNQLLIEEFTKDATLTKNHRLLANLPLETVWTTNYDDLIERAFEEAHKKVDVKRTKENMAITVPRRAVTIYKMHGDKLLPDEAVLTKEDYEAYDQKRSIFSMKLKGDLIERPFLFLGFSFTDPNIDYILSRVRMLLGENQREHFCIMKKLDKPKSSGKKAVDDFKYKQSQFEHRVEDLKRYCIQTVLIDDYTEISDLLQELNRRSHFRDVFVSGSADDYTPLGQGPTEELCRKLGGRIIQDGYNLVSGFGLGIGGQVIVGAMDALQRNDEERLILRPFPQKPPPGETLADYWKKYREEMISKAGICVFLCGNKKDPSTGTTVESDGVIEEFDIARKQGKYVIPIGATGHAAETIWKSVMADMKAFFPQGGVKTHLQSLGNPSKSIDDHVTAVFEIVKHITA